MKFIKYRKMKMKKKPLSVVVYACISLLLGLWGLTTFFESYQIDTLVVPIILFLVTVGLLRAQRWARIAVFVIAIFALYVGSIKGFAFTYAWWHGLYLTEESPVTLSSAIYSLLLFFLPAVSFCIATFIILNKSSVKTFFTTKKREEIDSSPKTGKDS
jgi:hypothetical protein